MSYQVALARLEAYAPKELIIGAYRNEAGVCAVGACCPELAAEGFRRVRDPMNSGPPLYLAAMDELGLTYAEYRDLTEYNDTCDARTRAERYALVLAWLRARVAREAR